MYKQSVLFRKTGLHLLSVFSTLYSQDGKLHQRNYDR